MAPIPCRSCPSPSPVLAGADGEAGFLGPITGGSGLACLLLGEGLFQGERRPSVVPSRQPGRLS